MYLVCGTPGMSREHTARDTAACHRATALMRPYPCAPTPMTQTPKKIGGCAEPYTERPLLPQAVEESVHIGAGARALV